MKIVSSLAAWRAAADVARRRGATVGLVPTMGALHAGHASLMKQARSECDFVVATIFVNPRQFNDAGDLAAYPSTPAADEEICRDAAIDLLVRPDVHEMWPSYPSPTATTVSVKGVSDNYEGAGRPGHFDGVASVVAKLFVVNGPGRAYFGEKDFQQVAVVRAMARDLGFDVTVVAAPIVRDADGLALSSRNVRLTPGGRDRALALSRTLHVVAHGRWVLGEIAEVVARELDGLDVLYADVVDPATLIAVDPDFHGEARLLLGASVDGVRLIDNGPVMIRRA
jgi:pantoate--beta-alanine ligase